MAAAGEPREPGKGVPTLEDFLGAPTRRIADWHWLWTGDLEFPIRSHRGFMGRLLVALKRLLRPLVKVPQNDLWERQRVFNLVVLEHLASLDELRRVDAEQEQRIRHLEAALSQGLQEVMAHDDALFARVDQKLDRYRREARQLVASLGAALARLETAGAPEPKAAPAALAELARWRSEELYLELEQRYRGTPAEIETRLATYLPYLAGQRTVLDLGCGRGESLALFSRHGLAARGVDGSAEMVAACQRQGLEAEVADLFEHLAGLAEGSLGAVVSFHVVEHLAPESLDRLVRLAWRVLEPGGVLILETPNPLSVVVAARNFWLDPTHRRPVHPKSLELLFEAAGFEEVETLFLRPFAAAERLPEVDLSRLPAGQAELAFEIGRLRDRLDELLFGHQDFALIGRRPAS